MSSTTFKLSTLAAFVIAATHANAALYQVVEITQPTETEEAYGSAIQESDSGEYCFTEDCGEGTNYLLAGDTLEGTAGFSYRQEVPFNYDNFFTILDEDDLDSYCDYELGYETCSYWAYLRWYGINDKGGLYRERQAWDLGTYESNATSFINDASASTTSTVTPPEPTEDPEGESTETSPTVDNTKNVVINDLDGTTAIGNTSSGYFDLDGNYALTYRNRGFYGDTLLLPYQDGDTIVAKMGRTMAFDSFTYDGVTYVVGSAATDSFDYTDDDKDYLGDLDNCPDYDYPAAYEECQNFAFAQKAYLWDVTNATTTNGVTTATGVEAADWNNGDTDANEDEESAEASIRGVVVVSDDSSSDYAGKPVMVGFDTEDEDGDGDNLMMQAAVFYPNDDFSTTAIQSGDAWTSTFITNAKVTDGDDYIYSNSVAKDINDNLLVIGESKRETSENGAYNNRLFIADASEGSPSASYFSGGIFFSGSGGEANAINNYNEIVGQIDAETHRENGGKKRRRRAFIYPYDGEGSVDSRREIFNEQAWWLDDLTNGDNGDDANYSTNNNQYRVFNASDINDAGVISASAFKCEGGYSSTNHFASCDDDEIVVAVKLVPINGATSSNITERSEDTTTDSDSRSGAGFGLLGLGFLGLLGFRRKQ